MLFYKRNVYVNIYIDTEAYSTSRHYSGKHEIVCSCLAIFGIYKFHVKCLVLNIHRHFFPLIKHVHNMQKRVIFTNDERNTGISDDIVKKLYSRITIDKINKDTYSGIKSIIDKTEDPLIKCIDSSSSDADVDMNISKTHVDDLSNYCINIDILVFENGDYVQCHGAIDNDVLLSLRESGLSKDISLSTLYIWIYGLLLIGNYDDGRSYKFEFSQQGHDNFWSIKLLHSGIFKIVLNLKITKKPNVDIDEYFIDDLQSFYFENIVFNNERKRMNAEIDKRLVEINRLKDKTIIEKLRNSVNLMKNRITNYFLPLINHLNDENNMLMKRIDDSGDTVFLSSRRKRRFEDVDTDNGDKFKIENLVKPEARNDGFDDDFVERERNKRLKYKEMNERDAIQLEDENKANKTTKQVDTEEARDQRINDYGDHEVSKGNDGLIEEDTQPDVIAVFNRKEEQDNTAIDENKNDDDENDAYNLEEDTELDDQTDVSDDEFHSNGNDNDDDSMLNAFTDDKNTDDDLTEISE